MDHFLCESLVREYNYLQLKIKELITFIKSPRFTNDSIESQFLILKQIQVMTQYQTILKDRLELVCKKRYNSNMQTTKFNKSVDDWDSRKLGAELDFAQSVPYNQELEDVINAMVEYYKEEVNSVRPTTTEK